MSKRCIIIVITMLSTTFSGVAQVGGLAILESFQVRQVNNTIEVDFAIKGGASCQGAQLQRSSDEELFIQIGEIQGICGGSEFTEHYKLVDTQPLEYSTNYYRLTLGNQNTTIVQIDFVRLENNYRVFPTPALNWTVIRFENPTNIPHSISIYTLEGGLVEKGDQITSQEIYLNLSRYNSGIYIFQLSSESRESITGKFVVRK
jgi:hypothetical protein